MFPPAMATGGGPYPDGKMLSIRHLVHRESVTQLVELKEQETQAAGANLSWHCEFVAKTLVELDYLLNYASGRICAGFPIPSREKPIAQLPILEAGSALALAGVESKGMRHSGAEGAQGDAKFVRLSSSLTLGGIPITTFASRVRAAVVSREMRRQRDGNKSWSGKKCHIILADATHWNIGEGAGKERKGKEEVAEKILLGQKSEEWSHLPIQQNTPLYYSTAAADSSVVKLEKDIHALVAQNLVNKDSILYQEQRHSNQITQESSRKKKRPPPEQCGGQESDDHDNDESELDEAACTNPTHNHHAFGRKKKKNQLSNVFLD